MLNRFLVKKDNDLVFTGVKLDVFIPMAYFDRNAAKFVGADINTFGLLNVKGYDNKDKVIFKEVLNIPSPITLRPPESINIVDENLTGYDKDTKYRVCTYHTNNPVMYAFISKNSDNVQSFLKMILSGYINNIPYDKLLNIWLKNQAINSVSLNVPASSMELVLSEIYRDPKNPDNNFAVAVDKNPKIDMYNYETINIRQLCSRNSTFTALSFEDFDYMVASSLNINKQNKDQKISPVEKTLKY